MKTTSRSDEPKAVGIWIRVSSEDQARGESPTHHLNRAKAFAEERHWIVKEVYDLAGISGKSVKEHPEAQRMLNDVKRGYIKGLIFSKLARLARNTKELLEFSDYFEANDADLISTSEIIDTSTPAGRLFFTIIAAMATWEREEIADRQQASILTRARLGKTINGKAPYGYRWVDRQLVPHPDEKPVRRQAYELFLQHRRKGAVAKILNDAGHRTRSKRRWCDRQIGRILVCTSAKGVYYFNRIRKQGAWKGTEKPEDEWGEVQCEPIVAPEEWEQVNHILDEQRKAHKKPGKTPTHPFAKLTWCACGGKMYARSDSPKYLCRKCNRKIPIADLDSMVRQELDEYFGSIASVEDSCSVATKRVAEKEAELAAVDRQIAAVRDEMDKTHRLYMEGQITPEGFGRFYMPAEERLHQLSAGLPKLQAEVARLKVKSVSAEEVIFQAKTFYDRWPSLDNDRKRRVAEAVLDKITVGEDFADFGYLYRPES